MKSSQNQNEFWVRMPIVTAWFAIVLAAAILIGLGVCLGTSTKPKQFDSVSAGVCGVGLLIAGTLLLLRKVSGYFGVLVILPWALLAVASVFPGILWNRFTVPNTFIGFVATAPLILLMSRRASMESLPRVGRSNFIWRGVPILAICVGIAWVLRADVIRRWDDFARRQERDGTSWVDQIIVRGFWRERTMCETVLWNYVPLLLAVLVPHGYPFAEDETNPHPTDQQP